MTGYIQYTTYMGKCRIFGLFGRLAWYTMHT